MINHYMMDSYQLNKEHVDLIKKLKLEKYFVSENNRWKPDFVGFIITENETIISFPKHYHNKNYKITNEDLLLMNKLMIKSKRSLGLDDEVGLYDNFPLSSYLYICNYYKKYGLYIETIYKKERNYKGKIDWRNTIRRSNKLISGNNLIFLPFIVEKNMSLEVLITECMSYSLNEGFNRFGKFFNQGIVFNKKNNNPIFNNKAVVIKQLNLLKSSYFKDSERLLIDNLIKYFKWSNENSDKTILITKNFELYWESMIEKYLNKNLESINELGEFKFKDYTNSYKFKKEEEFIETEIVRSEGSSRKFKVIYDHLYIKDSVAYLFDSKYFQRIRDLDYKQMSYYFILRSSEKYINKEIVTGLIVPTEEEYYSKVHLDAKDRDGLLKGLFISEHYINLKEVIKSFVDG